MLPTPEAAFVGSFLRSRNTRMSRDRFSLRFPFSAWPNPSVPAVAAGVYAIWKASELIYCGMSGREFDSKSKAAPKKYGLVTRLNSHASGRLSGDQFCVYVANRFVIPSLTPEELPLFATSALTLDVRTKAFIHEHFDYAYALVETSADAYELERAARRGDVFGVQPYLNPL
jgi:hypothetical protein